MQYEHSEHKDKSGDTDIDSSTDADGQPPTELR